MEKMTYVTALNFAINFIDEGIVASGSADWDEEARAVMDKLTALRDQQIKRNSSDRKPTKTQLENERLKGFVFEALGDKPQTVTEIMATSAELSDLSNQKVSALVNALVDEGKAVKTVEKRKSYFTRVEG